MKARLFIRAENILGEGSLWDTHRNELMWVDIERRLLCFGNNETGDIIKIELDSRIGAAVPVEGSDVYLVALQSGLKFYNRKTCVSQLITNPDDDIPQNRFNDGKYDPVGRFWIGSMDLEAKELRGNLYSPGGNLDISKKLENVTISNGHF